MTNDRSSKLFPNSRHFQESSTDPLNHCRPHFPAKNFLKILSPAIEKRIGIEYNLSLDRRQVKNLDSDSILKAVLNKLGRKYEYKKSLGGGGYSAVYLIRHTILGEDHALKIMDYDYIKKGLEKRNIKDLKKEFMEIKERFINEAKLYKRIRHRNIVGIYDVDMIEDKNERIEIPYITMDYIEGSSLDRILKDKAPLEWKEALNISMNVLKALDAIHKEKVIHRDIKSSNIMIKEKTGEAILIDFGLAKDKLNETTLTSSGVTMGTPAYMSPEQINTPQNIDSSTDIYSFGVVLYEMLTREFPFGGDKEEIIYGHLLKQPPNIRDKNPDLPVGIEDIIFKAMSKEPKLRYKSAGEFWKALNQVEETQKMIVREKKEEITEKIKPKEEDEEKKARKVELHQEEKIKIKKEEKEKIVEAKIESEKRAKGKEENKEVEKKEVEKIKEKKDIKKERKSPKKPIKYVIISALLITLITAIVAFFVFDPFGRMSVNPKVKRDYSERTEEMKGDFERLKAFYKGEASNKDKLVMCQIFLSKHQNVPGNNENAEMVSETNIFINKLQAEIAKDEQYQICIDAANEYKENGEYQKALAEVEKAKKIKDTEEIAALLKEIKDKQKIEIMKGDFETLINFLEGDATKSEKLQECQDFLKKHENTPRDNVTKPMVDETNQFITQLNTEIRADEQYQRHIDNVNRLIKIGDYQKADDELKKARDIKSTDEVKKLSVTIAKGLEAEKNGDKEYNTIKDNLDFSKYLAFKRKYQNSDHLRVLRFRIMIKDGNLPPEKYWENPMKKNKKGCYELKFGKEHNEHIMIYIPEKKIWIGKYEVSWAQFRKFVKDAKIQFPPIEDDKFIRSNDEYPAVIPYEYARKYCQKYGLRLPGIDEWEYAAGAGRYTYPWGNASPDKPDTNGNWMANFDSLEGTVEKDGFDGTAPVKSFEEFSSPFGVVNIAGNVWEWVQGNILKGGGFFSSIEDLKIKSSKPGNNDKEGFRCVKDEK